MSALPEHAADVARAADWLGERLRNLGATDVEVIQTALHPIVYARIHEAPGAPTFLVYCHYDVQPVDPIDLWETAPWEPFLRDGRFVGRGVADDKGQIVMHLAAIEALRAAGRSPAVNLTFVFEGEEEYGSESLFAWVAPNRDRLAADAAIISDTAYFEGNLPAITVGLRGIMYAQIDVELSPVDLHSGQYGGTVQNPANALARIVAALVGPDGRIRIPGFYDDVVALTDDEREAMAALPFDDEAYRAGIPVADLVGEAGWTTLERKRAGPRSTSTGCGAASRARAPRRSSRPTRTRSCRAASSRTRTRRRSSPPCGTSSRRSRRPAYRPDDATSTAASRRSPRSTIRRQRPPPGPSRRSTAPRPSTCARAGRSR